MPLSSVTADAIQASTTITANGASSWVDTGSGNIKLGMNVAIIVTAVIGNPNVLFGIEVSDDQSYIFSSAFDQKGPCSVVALRNIRFFCERRYWRLVWKWGWQDPVGASLNSSSSSGQSYASSSSAGGMSLTFSANVAAAGYGL